MARIIKRRPTAILMIRPISVGCPRLKRIRAIKTITPKIGMAIKRK